MSRPFPVGLCSVSAAPAVVRRWLGVALLSAATLWVGAGCGGSIGDSPPDVVPDAAPAAPVDAALDDDAVLDDLEVSIGELTPRFAADVSSYRVSVSLFVSQLAVTALPRSDRARVEIDGVEILSGQASAPLDLELGENEITIDIIAEAGTQQRYTITVNRTADVIERSYEKAELPDSGDQYGASLAVSGDYIAIGAPGESSADPENPSDDSALKSGGVFMLRREGASWMPDGYLKASNPGSLDLFGARVALDGDALVVGAPGEASADGDDPSDNGARDSGAAYVYRRGADGWEFEAYLKAFNPDALDKFGTSVAISGDTIAVGATGESSASADTPESNDVPDSGAVYIFERADGAWTQTAYLKVGNRGVGDKLGASAALRGDILVVGATGESSANIGDPSDDSAADSGAVYVFERVEQGWSESDYLKAGSISASDGFGASVALLDKTLIVGAPGEDSGSPGNPSDNTVDDSGAAYVFFQSESGWLERAYLKAGNLGQGDGFGSAVALSDGIVAVGAKRESSASADESDSRVVEGSGAAYVFLGAEATWTQAAFLKTVPAEANDEFATSIALENGLLVVGAAGEDSSVRVSPYDNAAPESGAAYIFE